MKQNYTNDILRLKSDATKFLNDLKLFDELAEEKNSTPIIRDACISMIREDVKNLYHQSEIIKDKHFQIMRDDRYE